ncbi:MAG: hypothetical protein ACE5JM_18015, partial [Armatimonadota bacterium]
SLSTPNLAGVTALIYDAYLSAHGFAPGAAVAKGILKSAADDAHQDPFLVGAGIANAHRAVLIANDTDGLSMDINEWNPGDYRGVDYAGYANLLVPGGSDMTTVTLRNHRPSSPLDVTIEDAVLASTGSLQHTFTRIPETDPNFFLLNDTGLMTTDGSVLVSAAAGLYSGADVIRVSMTFEWSRVAACGALRPLRCPQHLLDLFDWTDLNANGSFEEPDEQNLMWRDWFTWTHSAAGPVRGPNGFGFIHDPANRTHDGLAIKLRNVTDADVGIPVTVHVEYYERVDFPWVVSSLPMVTIPAGSTMPVSLTVTVPGDADPGLYEAVVLFKLDDGNVTTLPVVVNVAMPALPSSFGGNTYDSGPYQQGVQYGTTDSLFEPRASGDFRYYFFDLTAPANVTVLLEWDDGDSSNEIFVLSNETDWFAENLGARYGPGTEVTVGMVSSGSNTTSLAVSLKKGLSIIVVRSTYLAGEAPESIVAHRYMQLTGTSASAAVVSGTVALMLDEDPSLTPDQ